MPAVNPVLVLYATREGHTKTIAEYAAGKIQSLSLPVTLLEVSKLPNEFFLVDYSAAVIAASVHVGKHEPEILRFVKRHRADLNQMRTAFLSVSLSQAGAQDPRAKSETRAKAATDVKIMIDRFLADTGWKPSLTQPLAGALMYSKYNFLVRFIMRRIARRAGASTNTSRDHVFTRWRDLDELLLKLLVKDMVRPELGTHAECTGQLCQ